MAGHLASTTALSWVAERALKMVAPKVAMRARIKSNQHEMNKIILRNE